MFRRRPGKTELEDASAYSRRSAVADSAWSAQDRLRSSVGSALRDAPDALGRGFERVSFPIQARLVWPLEDRAGTLGPSARAVSFGAVVLLAAAAGVAGLIWAAPDRPDKTTATQVAAAPAAAIEVRDATRKPAEPTLHGAAPAFEPATQTPSEIDPAEAIVKSAPAESGDAPSAAAEAAAASASKGKPAGQAAAVDGPPAGPAAVAVARDFSDAFVVYETGGLDADVRRAFGATATPELSRALLRRPPRLPANVEVPRAKVLNVVAGPSHDGVYSVSVSLLRVGVTSELRLDMEQLKGKEWRVTNVLG